VADDSTVLSRPRAIWPARSALTAGLVDSSPIVADCATEVAWTSPVRFVTTTKSPPMTGRPLYARWYGTYCRPSGTEMTGRAANVSPGLAFRTAARVATRSLADSAASARDWAGDGVGGAAAGCAAPAPVATRPAPAKAARPADDAARTRLKERDRDAKTMVVVPS
jgi:hypothetical protein